MSFDETIIEVGQNLINDYIKTGVVKTGINGPYDDKETEVRDLSHLIIIACINTVLHNNKANQANICSMADRLLTMKSDKDGLYIIREKKGKDSCNGVIGHAWVIEAFVYAWKYTGKTIYLNEAIRIARMHFFNSSIGLWSTPGNSKVVDYTFNHQLWLAASLVELLDQKPDKKLGSEVNIFLNKLANNMSLSYQGKISHLVINSTNWKRKVELNIKKSLDNIRQVFNMTSLRYKEEGYHMFNMMAFARIYRIRSDLLVNNPRIRRAIAYINSESFFIGLENKWYEKDSSLHNNIEKDERRINIYGYPYNVPGFEFMYVQKVFEGLIDYEVSQRCMQRQMELTFDSDRREFGINCHDKIDINYRVYEYYRYMEVINERSL